MTFPILRDYSLDACLRKTVKIEFLTPDGIEGQVVFKNKQLPRPYPSLDLQNDDDREALNKFRRNIWGDLYLYGPGDYRPLE